MVKRFPRPAAGRGRQLEGIAGEHLLEDLRIIERLQGLHGMVAGGTGAHGPGDQLVLDQVVSEVERVREDAGLGGLVPHPPCDAAGAFRAGPGPRVDIDQPGRDVVGLVGLLAESPLADQAHCPAVPGR